MGWFLIWIFIAIICGVVGKDRECGSFYGFGWGLLCPPIGLIYVALSKKKKTMAEALQEAEILFKNGAISASTYDAMKSDILNGKIKDPKYYSDKSVINPFRK